MQVGAAPELQQQVELTQVQLTMRRDCAIQAVFSWGMVFSHCNIWVK